MKKKMGEQKKDKEGREGSILVHRKVLKCVSVRTDQSR